MSVREHLTVGVPAPRGQPTRDGADFSESFVSIEFARREPCASCCDSLNCYQRAGVICVETR